ncbi:telomeric repeat binding factor a isoform X1 [Hippoglossus stenolepis]|uniref:telomeric repeat binding factor a isoform X1 n=1 Tax=Hippoglossus stenolepis TaxID=195615 RepID=UPI00159C5501|nr:telomeric repeat binding factor a isoform X1 [Hippoglossus stenolepis]
MAAKATADGVRTEEESIVNRWIVDYYLSLALQAFDQEQLTDFCSIKHVLDSVLVRSLESTDSMPTKIRVLHFLSRINEGERLDVSSPLESALMLLQGMSKDCSIPQQEIENVCTSVKEMIVVILIKTNKFDKAKEMLTKHFPKPMVGKKAIFMGLINQRSRTHEVIQRIDFRQFKKKMFTFCQRLCQFTVPFLHKAAKQLIDTRLSEQDDSAAGPDEQEQPGPSSTPQINAVLVVSCKHNIIQRTRLEAAYKMLASLSDNRTFAQLEEEVEREEQERTDDLLLRLSPSLKEDASLDSEQDGVFQRGPGSPMEASVADHPPQTDAAPHTQAGSLSNSPSPPLRDRRLYTVARLVVEPDSQSSSQCTVASLELDTQVLEEESPQLPTIADENSLQSPLTDDEEVTKPTRKLRTRSCCLRSRASTSLTLLSTDSEKELSVSQANEESCVVETHNQSNSSLRSNSPKSQSGVESLDGDENQHESSACFRTPKSQQSRVSVTIHQQNDSDNIDSSLESSPSVFPRHPLPHTSSTPHKDSAHDKGPSHSKWKQLYSNAKESKETWSDEETHFPSRKNRLQESSISNSGHRKRKWTENETAMLKEGVKKFGEGNWSKIKSKYSFDGRTNVNLKDRWRTLKKINQA